MSGKRRIGKPSLVTGMPRREARRVRDGVTLYAPEWRVKLALRERELYRVHLKAGKDDYGIYAVKPIFFNDIGTSLVARGPAKALDRLERRAKGWRRLRFF